MRYPVFAKSKSSGKIMLFVSRDEAVILSALKEANWYMATGLKMIGFQLQTNLHGKFFRMKRCRKYLTMID